MIDKHLKDSDFLLHFVEEYKSAKGEDKEILEKMIIAISRRIAGTDQQQPAEGDY